MGANETHGERRGGQAPVFGGSCASLCRSCGGPAATRSSVEDALCDSPAGRAFPLCAFHGATKLSVKALLLGNFLRNASRRSCRQDGSSRIRFGSPAIR